MKKTGRVIPVKKEKKVKEKTARRKPETESSMKKVIQFIKNVKHRRNEK